MNDAVLPPTHLIYGVRRNALTYENGTAMSVVKNWAGHDFDFSI